MIGASNLVHGFTRRGCEFDALAHQSYELREANGLLRGGSALTQHSGQHFRKDRGEWWQICSKAVADKAIHQIDNININPGCVHQ
jgi:hypothetical protein